EPVENRVNVFDEVADTLRAKLWLEFNRAMIKLAQVGSGAEATFLCTRNDARGGFGREGLGGFDEFFELTEHHGADCVGGGALEREFDNAIAPFPTQSPAGERFHAVAFRAYIALISAS